MRSTLPVVLGMALAGAVGVIAGRVTASPDPLAAARAPLEAAGDAASAGGCDPAPLLDALPAPGGEQERRAHLSFRRHGDRAVLTAVADGLGDDSVEATTSAWSLEWSGGRWSVVSCARRVLACYDGRGSPPVCN